MPVPEEDLARVADVHARLGAAVAGLTDDDVRRPSLLPDWTVGHLLTHVARNADSHLRRTEAAARGEIVDQYPGGSEQRSSEIEAGAGRAAAELRADATGTAAALENAWRAAAPESWKATSRDLSGKERALADLPGRRWREVEIHLVDLGIGVTHRDWPDDFVETCLPGARKRAGDVPQFDDPREELLWLYGRLKRNDLPEPPPWG